MTLYLQDGRGLSPVLTGLCFIPQALVALHGSFAHRASAAMFVAARFALIGLLATRVVPAGPPHPHKPQPEHLFRHRADGWP